MLPDSLVLPESIVDEVTKERFAATLADQRQVSIASPLPSSPLASRLTPHTSHLTPHTSHLTPHTSHLTPHTTSHLTPPHLPHLSHLPHPTSHLPRPSSHIPLASQRGVTDEKLKELVSPENYKKYAAVARPSIEASIKGDFALKELGRQQNLVVSEDEVEEKTQPSP